jgi:hypothetical protein
MDDETDLEMMVRWEEILKHVGTRHTLGLSIPIPKAVVATIISYPAIIRSEIR